MNLLVCLLVIIITGTLVIKKFKAQTVLLLGGLIMMFGVLVRLYNIVCGCKESHRSFIF